MDKRLSNGLFTYRYEIRTCSTRRGRPRAFDANVALERAMHVFGPKVMKATRFPISHVRCALIGQVYAAFGNKEQLFRKVLDRMQAGHLPILTNPWRHRRRGM